MNPIGEMDEKNSKNSGLKHPHTYMNDHSVFVVRCGSETQPNQAARKLNGGNVELKHKQSIEHDLNITRMIKCKEKLNSSNKNEENSKNQRTSAGKRKWKLNRFAPMKQGVL